MQSNAVQRIERRPQADISCYVITDETLECAQALTVVRAALAEGVGVIQLRDKQRTNQELLPFARQLREMTRAAGALLLVNDRVDLALAVDADGCHLGCDDMGIVEARKKLGEQRIIGLTAADPHSARLAELWGADYIGCGHVFGSRSKQKPGCPIGVSGLADVCRAVRVPVVAIGAIDPGNAAKVIRAGAAGAAVVSGVSRARDVSAAARLLVAEVRAALSERMVFEDAMKSAAAAATRLRISRPVIHHITNYVSMTRSADATAAIGARPIMAADQREVAEVTARADALVLNTGTPSPQRLRAARIALRSAIHHAVPVVFDPVGVGSSHLRTAGVLRLLRQLCRLRQRERWTWRLLEQLGRLGWRSRGTRRVAVVVRCNAAELGVLLEQYGIRQRGVQPKGLVGRLSSRYSKTEASIADAATLRGVDAVTAGDHIAMATPAEGSTSKDAADITNDWRSRLEWAAREAADRFGCIFVVTGSFDLVSDGRRSQWIGGGDWRLPSVVGSGCILSSVIAAVVAVTPDPFIAAFAACTMMRTAAARAGKTARGPADMVAGLINELSNMEESYAEA